jgi:hypothetical protein
MTTDLPDTNVTVDFLLLADRAEALNGKLYMMGGAWDRLFLHDLTAPTLISLAVGVLVPWNQTNIQHQLTVAIEDQDGNPIDSFRMEAGFAAGRPPFAEQGERQRVILALPAVPVQLPRFGTYVLRADIQGQDSKRLEFRAVAVQPQLGPMGLAGGAIPPV